MSKERLKNLPIILYSSLLLAVWLYSWIRSVVALLCGEATETMLASSDGVRWFLRSSVDSVDRIPWAMIVILLMCSGVLSSCGLFAVAGRLLRGETSMRMRRALWSAVVAVVIMVLLLLFATLYPLNIFRSVSGGFVASPMAEGWPLLLFVVLFFLSSVFGVVGGAFKGVDDIVGAVSSRIKFHACSLVALVPAALLLASMEYEGIMDVLFGDFYPIFEFFLVIFPFAYRLFSFKRNKV
ncbi:MAG: AbgT family transporter [Bacteroidaceae bacterium]|nr:AbgT family transporter [Bacteroidaceae bacterium]